MRKFGSGECVIRWEECSENNLTHQHTALGLRPGEAGRGRTQEATSKGQARDGCGLTGKRCELEEMRAGKDPGFDLPACPVAQSPVRRAQLRPRLSPSSLPGTPAFETL